MKAKSTLLAALVVVATIATPAAAALTTSSTDATNTADAKAYAGTHVSYDVQGDAVVNYTVDGETMVDSVAVESESDYEERTDASGSVGLGTVVELDGLGLEMGASSKTEATVRTEGAAEIVTHDNADGTFVVKSGDGGQYVHANVGADADAEATADDRVVVETDDGNTSTFIVVGDGNVTVNEEGNVTANLGSDAQLVFRSSGEERSEDDKQVERMIANGTATAEVYVMEEGGETVEDTVTYGEGTTVETSAEAEHTVNVTVERSKSQGKVVVTHVSEAAVGATDSLDVTVDGDAAAKAESYSALRAAANGGDEAKYRVVQDASAQAEGQATVLVAFDHFSERSASISGSETTNDDGSDSDDGSDGDDGTDDGDAGSGMPGFGVTAALGALVAASFVALRVRE
ncbi:hypothetical protein [Halorubellus litoreus]|uniref:PGF-CTERM protein n=1 Tax=Halorubellus litoreus TaxID=755308 RepID=A0ABD5V903_9EURY